MKNAINFLSIIALIFISCKKEDEKVATEVPYASEIALPVPRVFNIPGTSVAQSITFSSKGDTFYFVTNGGIRYCTYSDGNWSNPVKPEFTPVGMSETPCLSTDGQNFFYSRGDDIWKVDKVSGVWGTAQAVTEIKNNATGYNYHPTIASNGNMYFVSSRNGGEKIFISKKKGNSFEAPEVLDNNVNKFDMNKDPYIMPDESYILFSRFYSDSNSDIYISFNNNGKWTEAKSIGSRVNTSINELRPCISPNGKYLFFTKARINESPLIYQIDWQPILDSLKNN